MKNFYTIVHEVVHLLGFNSNLFQYFLTEEGNLLGLDQIVVSNNGRNSLILPKVVEYAKIYFACDEIT